MLLWLLVEATALSCGRLHVEVELGTAPLMFDVRGDLFTEEAVEVVATRLVVISVVVRARSVLGVVVWIERSIVGLTLVTMVGWSLMVMVLVLIVVL